LVVGDMARYFMLNGRVGGPQFHNRKGRGSFRGRPHNEQIRQRHRGGQTGGFGPGPRSRLEDGDGDVSMSDGQDGAFQQRFNPYGRANRKDGRFDRDRRGGGGGLVGYRSPGVSAPLLDTPSLFGCTSSEKNKTWFKITIPYGKKYDKKWLLTALQNLCHVPFIPIHYSTEGNKVQFFLEDAISANALSKITRRITDTEGYKVVVLINPCPPPAFLQSDLTEQDLEHLKQCMSKRFDASEQHLDLNSIRTDPDLVSQKIKVILNHKNCMQAVVKIIEENIPELVCLNLSNNRLYKLDDFAELVNKVPNLKTLNLSHNELKSERELDKVRGFKLTELWLDRNPLCDHFKDQSSYISLSCFCFVRYYSVYDSGDRQSLLDAYHEGASFSLSIPLSMHNPFRYMLFFFTHNRLNVVAFLNELPRTQHDTASFSVDVNTYSQTLLAFTVSGVFKEVDGKSRDSVRAFSRVFIAVPAVNSGLCLVNDELFVRFANTEEIRRAFVAPAPTPSSSPVPTLSAPQQEMLSAFSQKSEMNLEWSQK
uniref:Zgc:153681 n=1 Tax=Astyanax mexicanus TaxID=7994 RepID=A0A8B9KQQ7_ASTMX